MCVQGTLHEAEQKSNYWGQNICGEFVSRTTTIVRTGLENLQIVTNQNTDMPQNTWGLQ